MALNQLIGEKYRGIVAYVPTVILLVSSIFLVGNFQLLFSTYATIVFIVAYIGAEYKGGILIRWRDLILTMSAIMIAFIVEIESNHGIYYPKPFFIFILVSLAMYLVGHIVGKVIMAKTSFFQSGKLSLSIIAAFALFVMIFLDHYIANALKVIMIFNVAVYLLRENFRLIKIMLIIFPVFLIDFITWMTGEHAFLELAIGSFVITYLLVLGSWMWMKNAGIGKWITANVLVALMVILPAWFFMLNDIFNSSLVTRELDPSVLKHPVIYEDDTISLESLKGKIVVLDAWNTSCGVCFKKFPDFDKVYNKFKSNEEVVILAVNTPNRRDKEGDAKRKIESKGYDFENLYFTADSTAKALNIHLYPQLVYINRDQTKALYSSLDTSPLLWNNPYRVIKRLLKDERFMDRFEVQ